MDLWNRKNPQAHHIFSWPEVGILDEMSTLTEYEGNDRRRAAGASGPPESADLREKTRHTMPSNFPPKSLKTNDGRPEEVTHFFKGRETRPGPVFHESRVTNLESRKVLNG